MLTPSYLTLQTSRLKPAEKWACEGEDLYLIFPESGMGQLSSFAANLRVNSGDMIAMSGRSGAKLLMLEDGGEKELVFKWFATSLDSLFPLFSPGEVCFLQNVTEQFRIPKVYPKANLLAGSCRQMMREIGEKLDLVHRSQLLRVVALLLSSELRFSQQKQTGVGDNADDHMLRVFEQLSSHELLSLSVEELADRFGCSRRHLSRLFHQRFGLSVATLRMEMRLLKASSLLRDPGVKIINVAEQCGFNHLGLFNTCFKRRFGLTPGVWRNTLHEKSQSSESTDEPETCPLQVSGICPMAGKMQQKLPQTGTAISAPKSKSSRPAEARNSGVFVGVSTGAKGNHIPKQTMTPLAGAAAECGHEVN
jgi:AraC-like DNA-binding protein